MPLADVLGILPQSHSLWNPATNLFEITVLRRNKPDLAIKNLTQQTSEQLRRAVIDALRSHQA